MLAVLVVLCVCAAASGDEEFKAECSYENDAVHMEPAGTLPGRYVVQYCTHTSPPITKWRLWLYTMDQPPGNCTSDEKHKIHHGIAHSYVEEMLNSSSVNNSCPYVCFSRPMDLIFESCYRILNQVGRQGSSKHSSINSELNTKHMYIKNNIPRYRINNTSAFVECNSYGEKVVCTWFEGLLPYTKYWVQLMPYTGSKEEGDEYTQVTDNCTLGGGGLSAGAVRCELTVAPGAYVLELRHGAPWAYGLGDLVHHRGYFNYTLPEDHVIPSTASLSVAWWSCGVVLLVALSLFVGLVVYQKRQKVKLKVKILKTWQWQARKAEAELTPESIPECACAPNPVLLLYARDCPPAQRAANALKQLIRELHGGQVLDLYEADTVARTAAASNAFVQCCMSTPSVRVVLLQTPALAALHTTRLQDSLTLSEPLLPRRAAYRRPHAGDHLLQYALRLLRETSSAQPLPYRKYFLCTLSDLTVDVFPDVVPFTRFCLPDDAPALVHALQGPSGPHEAPPAGPAPPAAPGALDELSSAAVELVNYVAENPNYLAERITFFRTQSSHFDVTSMSLRRLLSIDLFSSSLFN